MQNRETHPDLADIAIGRPTIYISNKVLIVKRRKALRSLGLGLSAGLLVPQLVASCKKEEPGPEVNYDGTVAILGAGAAGLYAADILRSKGIKIIVLEAGSEYGGRIKSLRNQNNITSESIADFPVELGAEITYGSDSIWGKIIQNLNVPTVDLATAVDDFILGTSHFPAAGWGSDPDFLAVQNFIAGLPNYAGPAVSVKAAAGVSERAQALLNSQAGNFYGSTSALVGALGLSEGLKLIKHDDKRLVMKANPLQDLLISRFSLTTPMVQLNTAVTSIDYSTDPITITDAKGGTHMANKVIVTFPLAVMKSGDVSFSPALPGSMTSSLANIGMDPSIRVVIDFKKNFWGENAGIIWGGTAGPQYFNAGAGRSQYYKTLSITINGAKAAELSPMGPDMINPILAELDAVYATADTPNPATLYVRTDVNTNQILSIIKDWSKDDFIKGGYSYPLIGTTLDDRKNIGAPIDGKIFFAGEATDVSGDAGTINGALASAERVAEEVVKSITGAQ